MTVKLNKYGNHLVTRQCAKKVLQDLVSTNSLILDFAGVKVANHCFADELGKGLAPSIELSKVTFSKANSYVQNCMNAGFATALISA